ncbi:hypothetical protein RIR_jg29383.t1 [Rhizophagus irregularis DAOM 181602=DAOM 197198]|nr:hypothetical protein RIR_jg29383.t1 [Rhizophagus irregularis DAOM 181602=DAOM 197198]
MFPYNKELKKNLNLKSFEAFRFKTYHCFSERRFWEGEREWGRSGRKKGRGKGGGRGRGEEERKREGEGKRKREGEGERKKREGEG